MTETGKPVVWYGGRRGHWDNELMVVCLSASFCGRRGFNDLFVPATAAVDTTNSKERAVAAPFSLPGWRRRSP